MQHKPYSCIIIDPTDGPPVKQQIQRHIEYLIAIGGFRAGERLPSAAELAQQLGVNANTVRAAYEALLAQGTIRGVVGHGSYVSDTAKTPALLQAVSRAGLSPAIGMAKSIGCSRVDILAVVNELLDNWFPLRKHKRKET